MHIALAADHAGFALKEEVRRGLEKAGHRVEDFGPASEQRVDYPDFASAVARAVAGREVERGILVCGTGIGMAIAANKVAGVRAANCNDLFMAEMARRHNDANVLTLGARVIGSALAEAIVQAFVATPYDGGRHQDRLDKITALEDSPSTCS